MITIPKKQYYVIYDGKDTGFYKTTYWVVCITEDEEVAKDFCKKFGYSYKTETVGEERATPYWVKSYEDAS
jgi:hypothetical protein